MNLERWLIAVLFLAVSYLAFFKPAPTPPTTVDANTQITFQYTDAANANQTATKTIGDLVKWAAKQSQWTRKMTGPSPNHSASAVKWAQEVAEDIDELCEIIDKIPNVDCDGPQPKYPPPPPPQFP